MVDVLVCDNSSLFCNSYGGDMKMLHKVLSATGFGSIDFTPINIDHAAEHCVRPKRQKTISDVLDVDQDERFKCGICTQTFSAKKSRDRHRESIHKQQQYPCHTCSRVFTRKDMRTRHQNEKHNGRRRLRPSMSTSARAPLAMGSLRNDNVDTGLQIIHDMTTFRQSSSTPTGFETRMPNSPASSEDLEPQRADDDDDVEEVEPTHNGNSPMDCMELGPIDHALLLCTNLLIRAKPYKRFFIHDKKRDLISRKKWRVPDYDFWSFYGLAIRTLRLQLAADDPDAELLAAVAAFVNVDVLINGAERMGYHARAMYALKAHHRSRRDPIFDALEAAYAQCGKVCRTVRIIYTKHGFVWMLNVSESSDRLKEAVIMRPGVWAVFS